MAANINPELQLKITADARAVALGLQPLEHALENAGDHVDELERQLDALDRKKVQLNMRGEAIDKVKRDLETLREMMADDITLGIDTKEAEAMVRRLEAQLRGLNEKQYKAEVKAELDEDSKARLLAEAQALAQEVEAELSVEIELDENQFERDLLKLRDKLTREMEKLHLERFEAIALDVDADTRDADKKLVILEAQLNRLRDTDYIARVGIELDRDRNMNTLNGFSRFFDSVQSSVEKIGARSANSFLRIFGRTLAFGGPALSAAFGALLVGAIDSAMVAVGAAGGFVAITAGLVGALQDDKIEAAAKLTGTKIKESFIPMGEAIKEPFLQSLTEMSDGFDTFWQDVADSDAWKALAPELATFAAQIVTMFEKLAPGFNALIRAAQPFLLALGEGLGRIAESLTEWFESIDNNSAQFVAGFNFMITAVQRLIDALRILGDVSAFATDLGVRISGLGRFLSLPETDFLDPEQQRRYGEAWDDIIEGAEAGEKRLLERAKEIDIANGKALAAEAARKDALDKIAAKEAEAKRAAAEMARAIAAENNRAIESMKDLADAAVDTATALSELFDTKFSGRMDLDEALLALQGGLAKFKEEIGDTRDIRTTTKAGRDTRQLVLDRIKDAEQFRAAQIETGKSIADADAKFQANLATIAKQTKALGFNKTAVDEIINKYKSIPTEVGTAIKIALDKDDLPFLDEELKKLGLIDEKKIVEIKPELLTDPAFLIAWANLGHDVTKFVTPEMVADPTFSKALADAKAPVTKAVQLEIGLGPHKEFFKPGGKLESEMQEQLERWHGLRVPVGTSAEQSLAALAKTQVPVAVKPTVVPAAMETVTKQLRAFATTEYPAYITLKSDPNGSWVTMDNNLRDITQNRVVVITVRVDQDSLGRAQAQLNSLKTPAATTRAPAGMQQPAVNLFVRDSKLGELVDVQVTTTNNTATRTVSKRNVVSA